MLAGGMRAAAVVVTAALAVACARTVGAPVADPPAYSYVLALPSAGSWILGVDVTLERAPSEALVVAGLAGAVREVARVEASGEVHAVPPQGERWRVAECRTRCHLRYQVDLQALAAMCQGIDCAQRVGRAVVGSAAAWMLMPEPTGDAVLRVRVGSGDPSRFATGLRRDRSRGGEGGYVFRARELGEASYTAFGELRTSHLEVDGAALDVELLGPPLAMTDAKAVAWVRNAAACVAPLFGRFPVDATVFVVPVPGAEEVVFGRAFSLAGASVVLLFGSDTRAETAHDDWVVVHELFHLGTPSFVGEGHWLEEGLATFYEPLLRERAGWMSEADLWKHFVEEMPRGQRKAGAPQSIEEREDIDSTYWGGALFALLADIRIIQDTRGERSLDDALRAALAREGDATHEARVHDFLQIADEATATRVLAQVYTDFALHGAPVDLPALWRSLGIEVSSAGAVRLHDDAPLAWLRKAIGSGSKH
jgi:predicted metalloprotease with PDZ domain